MSRLTQHSRSAASHSSLRRGALPSATAVEFVKLSPTENMTLLVTSGHPSAHYPAIAAQLLQTQHVHAEQVGFIRTASTPEAHARLHMAGDEFCGNACMALAAYLAAHGGLLPGRSRQITLEASGSTRAVHCLVEHRDSGYHCQLSVPGPLRVEPYRFPGAETAPCALLRYPEAIHLVLEGNPADPHLRAAAQNHARNLALRTGIALVGVMLYDPIRQQLAPLIHVPALDSMVFERSCGSGTGAVGAYLAATGGRSISTAVHQPGGTMHVSAQYTQGTVTELGIGGQVRIIAEGTAYVHI